MSSEKKRAERAYEDFHEEAHEGGRMIGIPTPPSITWELGRILSIAYEAKINGELVQYEHEFRSRSAPFIAVSIDGKSMFFAGGRYRVTARGITDT